MALSNFRHLAGTGRISLFRNDPSDSKNRSTRLIEGSRSGSRSKEWDTLRIVTNLTQRIARSSSVRRASLTAYRSMARRVFFLPPPRVVLNSMPKAGTHVLTSLFRAFPRMMFTGTHHNLNDFSSSPGISARELPDLDVPRLEKALRTVRSGQYTTAHFPFHHIVVSLFRDLEFRSVLILRDPRDVAISHTRYVTNDPRHFLYERYQDLYRSDEERLMATITGFAADEHSQGQESVGERLAKYIGWIGQPSIHVCRFEDLVGERGGGTRGRQREAVTTISKYVDRPLADDQLDRVCKKVWSSRTATFRKGRIGDWREHFSAEHRAAFKESAARGLVDLGYEQDDAW